MTAFSTSRPLAGGATDAVKVLADNGTADGDITLLQIAQHGAAKGLLPASGTPLDGALDALTLAAQTAQTKADAAAPAITASPVVPTGTAISRTATAGAATGHYNRPLHITENKVVSSVGAVDSDQVYAFNDSAVPRTLTVGSVVATIPAKAWGELTRAGGAWYDTSATAGTPSSYTDAQARAAAVLPGALGTSTTQAPTHAAVSTALASVASGVLPVVEISSAGVTTDITRANHLGKRVVITSTAGGSLARVMLGAWQEGDAFELVCGSDGLNRGVRLAPESGLLGIYPALGTLNGKNTFVRLEYKGGRFEIVDSSFQVYGGQDEYIKTGAWFGSDGQFGVSQWRHNSGPNMDWYEGNCFEWLQCNHGGPGYQNSPWEVKRFVQSTMARVKPAGAPSYGQQSISRIGVELTYYGEAPSSNIYYGQTNVHATLEFAQSLASNADALDAGEHNWVFCGSPGGTLFAGSAQAAYKGIYGGWTTNGNWTLRRGFGVASELIDTTNGAHNVDVPVGCSNVIQNGNGAGTVAHFMPDMRDVGNLADRSVDVRFSIVQPRDLIQISGPQVNLGTLPNTAGSFFTLRWSPALVANDGNAGAWHRIG